MPLPSVARIYAEVNAQRPAEYSDIQSCDVPWVDNEDDYQIVRRIGSGVFSEVFEALIVGSRPEKCAIKVLKPVMSDIIKKEIKILDTLRGGPNIITLLAVLKVPCSPSPALAFEYAMHHSNYRILCLSLTYHDVCFYMFELLKALDYAHSMGIMHRDVKPQNIMIDHPNRMLKLVDWGLAEFYHPGKEYSPKVATLYYKGPELLIGYKMYDYSMDMWSFGCVMAGMFFRKEPFFYGNSSLHQLKQITDRLGTERLYEYMDKYQMDSRSIIKEKLPKRSCKGFQGYIATWNQHLISLEGMDLLDKVLRYDHSERLTAYEAMHHPYFRSNPPSLNPHFSVNLAISKK